MIYVVVALVCYATDNCKTFYDARHHFPNAELCQLHLPSAAADIGKHMAADGIALEGLALKCENILPNEPLSPIVSS